nr:hypothetical protein [Maliibacterium massiliense]
MTHKKMRIAMLLAAVASLLMFATSAAQYFDVENAAYWQVVNWVANISNVLFLGVFIAFACARQASGMMKIACAGVVFTRAFFILPALIMESMPDLGTFYAANPQAYMTLAYMNLICAFLSLMPLLLFFIAVWQLDWADMFARIVSIFAIFGAALCMAMLFSQLFGLPIYLSATVTLPYDPTLLYFFTTLLMAILYGRMRHVDAPIKVAPNAADAPSATDALAGATEGAPAAPADTTADTPDVPDAQPTASEDAPQRCDEASAAE